MVAWSCLSRLGTTSARQITKLGNKPTTGINLVLCRNSGDHGHKTMTITASRWQWHKFKDLLHYYTLLGLIPVLSLVFCVNVFVGPATLTEIPEGYEPKHWEYHRHPISRFLARYVYGPHQQDYEKFLHVLYEENEKKQLRALTEKIEDKMAERQDYYSFYYRPVTAKHLRISKEYADKVKELEDEY
ncbi:NADH dehydrogenase [ubiquinone] 1 beta subcomplex subunit 5, mitochondrial-like [Ctenocephalides felis]|uniref:NADH dehydrogenase [ubiquinone] 1 beta subcomplex subunit 5, mitochondrial-like n=1 Tax=Ctenocephalides felis TaxID=7515 RepID=UPI000E6E4C20|nr:NADH dehydrogenase [ubiquinone] 1 beta subcomplex subunit 5, mitochondrial-like [Ctenocephalides felis]